MHSAQVFVVLVALFSFTQAGGDHKFKCMGKELVISDDSKAALKTCYEANKPDEGSKMPKACMMPCIYDKIGCMKDNKFDMDSFKTKAATQFPEEAREKIIAASQTCFDSFGASMSMDEECKSWGPFIKCMVAGQKDVCGEGCGMGSMEA